MNSPNLPLRSWVEISSAALIANITVARKQLGQNPKLIAVIKANGYGHGQSYVAKTLSPYCNYFAVANLREAFALRREGITTPILLLSACLPTERPIVVQEGFIPTISSAAEGMSYADQARKLHCQASLAFKIDTGMGRLGALPDDAPGAIAELVENPNAIIEMVSTHLPSADHDPAFTQNQLARFAALERTLRPRLPRSTFHALNSAGILRFPEHGFDAARPGLMLYGISPIPEFQHLLKPALTWKAAITQIRNVPIGTTVSYGRTYKATSTERHAVLPVGYADGYHRAMSGQGAYVLVAGQRCPVLGIITMDQIVIDITHLKTVEIGSLATLIGTDGFETLYATDLARWANTIAWEIFTSIGPRVQRIYSKPI